MAVEEWSPACQPPKLPFWGVLFTKNLLGKPIKHNHRRNACQLSQSSKCEGAENKYQLFVENQQHEKEVPRLTRSADLGGKRDNSGNRREVKKKKTL